MIGDDEPCIVGVGETDYCRTPGSGVSDLQVVLRAARLAAADAGLSPRDLDGVMTPFLNASAEELADNLEPISAFGVSASIDDEVLHGMVKLTTD